MLANVKGESVASDANHAAVSAKRRLPARFRAPALCLSVVTASAKTARRRRFSGEETSTLSREASCDGRSGSQR
jgi:hypothetical protein